jgi:hypothetical protein
MGRNRRRIPDSIEIFVDGECYLISDDPVAARAEIYQWFMKTPFWLQTSMFFNYYKKTETNERYLNKDHTLETASDEKNLFFMNDDNPYICLRCRRPSEIVGFCGNCYNSIYGLENAEEWDIPIEDVKCHPRFIKVVEGDPKYTEEIKQSMIKDGMRNPIIVDADNRILIGHHRYYIAKDLGWKTIRCKQNNIKFNYGYFYEGKGSDVFVARIDGELYMSTTEINDIMPLITDFQMKEMGETLHLECFLNVGSDIRLRNVFIPERGDVVDPTWYAWYIRKFNKKPKIGRFS